MTRVASGGSGAAVNALPVPASPTRPPRAHRSTGATRIRAELQRRYYVCQEYLESAATRDAESLIVSGQEKQSGAPLRTLYFGSGNHRAYVLALLYDEYRVVRERRHLRAWQARRWLATDGGQADIVVADLPWPYDRLLGGSGFLEVPAWIDQSLQLPYRWDDLSGSLRGSAKGEDLRKVRKYGLTYRIVRDEKAVGRFYTEMYVPHVTSRFGAAAYVEPEWKIHYCAANGALMQILRDGEVVAGQVLYGDRDSLQFLWAGAQAALSVQQLQGAFPALFYYGLLYAFEHGYRCVDYCGSRPLLSDGVFQLKRRWGGAVSDGWSHDTLFIRPNDLGPANLAFLARCPLVARSGAGLVGKAMVGREAVRAEHVARADQSYATAGLRAIRLYSLQAPTPEALEAARASARIELVDLSGEQAPATAYCAG